MAHELISRDPHADSDLRRQRLDGNRRSQCASRIRSLRSRRHRCRGIRRHPLARYMDPSLLGPRPDCISARARSRRCCMQSSTRTSTRGDAIVSRPSSSSDLQPALHPLNAHHRCAVPGARADDSPFCPCHATVTRRCINEYRYVQILGSVQLFALAFAGLIALFGDVAYAQTTTASRRVL